MIPVMGKIFPKIEPHQSGDQCIKILVQAGFSHSYLSNYMAQLSIQKTGHKTIKKNRFKSFKSHVSQQTKAKYHKTGPVHHFNHDKFVWCTAQFYSRQDMPAFLKAYEKTATLMEKTESPPLLDPKMAISGYSPLIEYLSEKLEPQADSLIIQGIFAACEMRSNFSKPVLVARGACRILITAQKEFPALVRQIVGGELSLVEAFVDTAFNNTYFGQASSVMKQARLVKNLAVQYFREISTKSVLVIQADILKCRNLKLYVANLPKNFIGLKEFIMFTARGMQCKTSESSEKCIEVLKSSGLDHDSLIEVYKEKTKNKSPESKTAETKDVVRAVHCEFRAYMKTKLLDAFKRFGPDDVPYLTFLTDLFLYCRDVCNIGKDMPKRPTGVFMRSSTHTEANSSV